MAHEELKSRENSSTSPATAKDGQPSDNSIATWRRWVVGQQLGIVWFLAFAAGVCWIAVTSRNVTAVELDQVIPLLAVIIVYWTYGLFLENKNTRTFADSLYFMGFLWTLAGLIALFVLSDIKTGAVLRAFGITLFTTAVGMLLRVVTLQTHETLPDRLLDAQQDIDKRVTAFCETLCKAASDIERFREDAAKVLKDQITCLSSLMTTLLAEIRSVNLHAATESATALQKAVDALVGKLNAFHLPYKGLEDEGRKLAEQFPMWSEQIAVGIGQIEGAITKSAGQIEGSGRTLAAQVRQLETRYQELAGKIAQVCTTVEGATQRLAKEMADSAPTLIARVIELTEQLLDTPARRQIDESFRAITSTLNDVNADLQKIGPPLNTTADKLATATDSLRTTATTMASLEQSLTTITGKFERLSSEDISRLVESTSRAERAIADSLEAATLLRQTTSEVLEFVKAAVKGGRS